MYQGKRKITGMIVLAVLLCILSGNRVLAAGNVTISADKETAAVGDVITVTVKAENPADAADAPQISVEYDANRLSFMECDKEYGGGGGGLVTLADTEADISFSVLSGGTAEVKVSAVLDGDGADVPTASVQIAVDGEDTAAQAGGAGQTETGVEAGTIMSADGTKVVSTVFADEFMPALFHKTTVTYEEQMVEAAQFDMGDIILLYVTDTSGNNGTFNIYDKDTGTLSDFRKIDGIENRFIIVLPTDETAAVPAGFTKATLQWNSQTLEAYMITSTDGAADSEEDAAVSADDVSSADFFLLYAISSEGNKGWYLYDQAEGTYQRFLQVIRTTVDDKGNVLSSPTEPADTGSGGYKEQSNRRLLIICILAAVMLIMFIVMLNMFLKLRDYQSYEYIDEEDEGDYEEEEDENEEEDKDIKTSRLKASELARMQLNEPESDEDLEMIDDYEDEDEDSLFTPRRRERKSKKEKKSRKNKQEIEEPQAIDWSEFEHTIKDSTEDERRPRGNRAEDLPPMYRQGDQPPAELPESAVETPKVNAPKAEGPRAEVSKTQPQQSYEQPRVQQPQYGQPRVQQPPYEQPYAQQPYVQPQYEQPYAQQPYEQPQYAQQQYTQPQYAQPPYAQPQMQQTPQQNAGPDLDLDEDFEFEFINLDE